MKKRGRDGGAENRLEAGNPLPKFVEDRDDLGSVAIAVTRDGAPNSGQRACIPLAVRVVRFDRGDVVQEFEVEFLDQFVEGLDAHI